MNETTIKNEPEKWLVGFLQIDGSKVYIEPNAIKIIEEYGEFTKVCCGRNPRTGEAASEICVYASVSEVIASLRLCNVFIAYCGKEEVTPSDQLTAKP